MKYSWFVFALIQKVESFQSRSSGYMKHMEIAPAVLPEGLTLTFFGVINKIFIFSSFISIEKKRSCFHTQDSVPLSGVGFPLDL